MPLCELSQRAFTQLQRIFREASGIELTDDKRSLVQARLGARVDALGHASFEDYCHYLQTKDNGLEQQALVDLLTTNETYFFREPHHFLRLGAAATTRFKGRPLRVWSAACSSGEEAYSLAMTLLDRRPDGAWQVIGTDLSSRMLERARTGVFPLQRLENMPTDYLKRYCLRGKDAYEGHFRVAPEVRQRVKFTQHNLMHDLRPLGLFEVIFLRNVLIYFSTARKQDILLRVLARLQEDGLLFVGHAEPLHGLALPLRRVEDAIFERKR